MYARGVVPRNIGLIPIPVLHKHAVPCVGLVLRSARHHSAGNAKLTQKQAKRL